MDEAKLKEILDLVAKEAPEKIREAMLSIVETAWRHGHVSGHKIGYKAGHAEGYDTGWDMGYKEGAEYGEL